MKKTAAEIRDAFEAAGVSVELRGNPNAAAVCLSPHTDVRPDSVIFIERRKDIGASVKSQAAIVVVSIHDMAELVSSSDRAILGVDDVRHVMPILLSLFDSRPVPAPGVHSTAVVGKGTKLGDRAAIGAYAVIGENCRIGAGVVIDSHVTVGPQSSVGEGTRLFSGARIYDGIRVGDRCRIHSGAVIGSDGYGYVTTAAGHKKIPQIGGVRIEDDVEIGANVTIDRGAVGDTVIGRGTKIDNLVHIAHNVQVGEHSLLIAQSGIAGSTRLGGWTVLAAQAGVAGHIEIGDRTMIGGKSGVTKSSPGGRMISGFPARLHSEEKRIKASFGRLPELVRDVFRLKAAVLRLSKRVSAVEHDPLPCNTH